MIDELTKFLGVVLWPLVTVIAFTWFKSAFEELLKSMSLKKIEAAGVVLEFSHKINILENRADEQKKRTEAQQKLINSLVTSGIGEWVYVTLREVARRQLENSSEYLYRTNDDDMRSSLKFLIDHGYVEPLDLNVPHDLVRDMKIKESGLLYVLFRGDRATLPANIDERYIRVV
jgi:hypothetical protein